jgi:Flp pilus assembly protein CpaB
MSTGHVVMVIAGLLGVVLTLSILRTDDDHREVLVAARDLVPGTVIDRDSMRTDHLDASAAVLATTFAADEVEDLRGRIVSAPIEKGALVSRDAVEVSDAGAAARSMSFPLPKARALAGALDRGDRVDVLAVRQDGAGAGYVTTGTEVLAVDGASGGPLGTDDDLTITLAVDAGTAVRLAAALQGGTVTLVRSTGAAAAPDAPAFTVGGGDVSSGAVGAGSSAEPSN